jgi:hypothetical protein
VTDTSRNDEAEDVVALLRHFNWSQASLVNGLYEVWTDNTRGSDEEILVPLDPQRGDFEKLVDRARRAIVTRYGREASDLTGILNMRRSAVLDSTRWKKATATDNGIIQWDQGELLYTSARAQLSAAAKSAAKPRRHHGGSGSYLSKRFLEQSFMGQTEVGSFIITAYTPATHRFFASKRAEERAQETSELFDQVSVSGRTILDTFERALFAVRNGLDDYKQNPRLEPFLEMVEEGVSYELAKSLGNTVRGGEAEIEIVRETSRTSDVTHIAFDPPEAAILDSIAIALASDQEPRSVNLIGEVTLLRRSSESVERVISLDVKSGADINKARVRLSADQYQVALDAHRLERQLQVSGRLEREGQYYWLYDATDVDLHEGSQQEAGAPSPQRMT